MLKVTGLVRATHPVPTLAVTALAAVLCLGFGVSWDIALMVVGAVLFNQASVGISNDALDNARDSESQRWEKPIPAGHLSLKTAWIVAVALAVASLVMSLAVGPLVALWQGIFLAAGWAYNLGLKGTVWSGACYVVGFGSLPVLVSYAAPSPQFPAWWVVAIAALLGLSAHFANVLPDVGMDRSQGVVGLPHRLGPRAVPLVVMVMTGISGVILVVGAGPGGFFATIPAGALALSLGVWSALMSRKPDPGALPFQLSMASALALAVGLAVSLSSV